jgi:hypothetical protein
MSEELDTERCEALITRDAGGDATALNELVEMLWPHWIVLVKKSRHMGSMAKSEDHVHNVVTALVDKLASGALGGYPSWRRDNAGKTFADWNRIVTSFAVRDYVRHALGRRSGGADPSMPSVKRLLNDFASSPIGEDAFGSARPAMTAAQTARQLLEFVERELPAEQVKALTLWIEGAAFEEIDEALGSTESDAAKKLVRAACAVLRRRFGKDDA